MIQIQNLTKTYDGAEVIKNITLEIEPNSVTVLNGISGSGKSTLMALIAGFIKPTSGDIIIDGLHIPKLPDLHISKFRAQHIGFVHQSYNLIEQLNVYENVIAPIIPYKNLHENIDIAIQTALSKAKIAHKKEQDISTLSGGEKQRVSIARAIVNNPKVLLCDEPTANLDYENSIAFIETLRGLKEQGRTIIIATHDPMFFELDFVDKVINIEHGALVD